MNFYSVSMSDNGTPSWRERSHRRHLSCFEDFQVFILKCAACDEVLTNRGIKATLICGLGCIDLYSCDAPFAK